MLRNSGVKPRPGLQFGKKPASAGFDGSATYVAGFPNAVAVSSAATAHAVNGSGSSDVTATISSVFGNAAPIDRTSASLSSLMHAQGPVISIAPASGDGPMKHAVDVGQASAQLNGSGTGKLGVVDAGSGVIAADLVSELVARQQHALQTNDIESTAYINFLFGMLGSAHGQTALRAILQQQKEPQVPIDAAAAADDGGVIVDEETALLMSGLPTVLDLNAAAASGDKSSVDSCDHCAAVVEDQRLASAMEVRSTIIDTREDVQASLACLRLELDDVFSR